MRRRGADGEWFTTPRAATRIAAATSGGRTRCSSRWPTRRCTGRCAAHCVPAAPPCAPRFEGHGRERSSDLLTVVVTEVRHTGPGAVLTSKVDRGWVLGLPIVCRRDLTGRVTQAGTAASGGRGPRARRGYRWARGRPVVTQALPSVSASRHQPRVGADPDFLPRPRRRMATDAWENGRLRPFRFRRTVRRRGLKDASARCHGRHDLDGAVSSVPEV